MSPIVTSRAAVTTVTASVMASLASLVALVTATPAIAASPPALRADDHLTVTVRHAGAGRDGTYRLSCHPGSGSHPDVAGACSVVDRNTRWGSEPFAPVPQGSVCTMQYGGPAAAHVTGTWAGRPVDATYHRSDGCEIARWNRMVPLLPDLGGQRSVGDSRTVHGRFMTGSPLR
ncbi:SSI family serine proteinase inhibitor [Streptomyces sp. NPDC002758]